MSIRTYVHEGETFLEVYQNIRSKIVPHGRRQKILRYDRHGNRIVCPKIANSEEKRLIQRLMAEIAHIENRGLLWDDIVARWESHHLRYPTDRFTAATVKEYAGTITKWTADWAKMPARDINSNDVGKLFLRAEEAGKSHALQKSLKTIINTVFRWAINERLVDGLTLSPATGVGLTIRSEERVPEILSTDQVRTLLREAVERKHEWFSVWVLALATGCRTGELLALRHGDVSLISTEAARVQETLPAERRQFGTIRVERNWSKKLGRYKCPKARYWRTIPVSGELYWFLKDLMNSNFGADEYGKFLLPHHHEWKKGEQARILREFCDQIGIPSVKFHALRACWATHLLQLGVPSVKVMKVGGWKNMKTMEVYLRLAGVDVAGITEGLGLLSIQPSELANVVNFGDFSATRPSAPSTLEPPIRLT